MTVTHLSTPSPATPFVCVRRTKHASHMRNRLAAPAPAPVVPAPEAAAAREAPKKERVGAKVVQDLEQKGGAAPTKDVGGRNKVRRPLTAQRYIICFRWTAWFRLCCAICQVGKHIFAQHEESENAGVTCAKDISAKRPVPQVPTSTIHQQ